MRVLSQSETEQRYRQLGRHDQLRTYQRMMRRRSRGARRRLIPNVQQNAQSKPTIQAAQQITPLNQAENQPQNQTPQNQTPQNQTPQNQTPQNQTPQNQTPQNQTPQNQTPQNQTPYAPNQMGRYTPYRRRRTRQNERYRNEHIEDRTCYICYTDMLRGECTDVCLTCEYRFHKVCIGSWFMYNRNRTCPMCRATFIQSPTTFVPETPSPPPLIDLENINLFEILE